VIPDLISFFIVGSQLAWDALPGTWPSPVASNMIPL